MQQEEKIMAFIKERLGKWIEAAIILTVGILCIVAGASWGNNDPSTAEAAIKGINNTLGILLIVVGSLSLIFAILVAILAKKGFALVALPGGILLAVGISIVAGQYAFDFIKILLYVVPFLLIAVGAIVLGDAIFTFVFAAKEKKTKEAIPGLIVGCIVAAAAIVLGALCIGNKPVISNGAQLIVFGIVLCLVACFMVLITFIRLPSVTIISVEEKE